MYPSADVVVVLGPAQDAERTRHVNSARALDCGPRHAAGGENETGVQRDATLPPTGGAMRPKQQK